MQDEHRSAIQKNFVSLVERTDIDSMVTALYEKQVFSERMIEPYRESNKDARERKRQLFMDITRRGPHAFGHLVECLTELGHWDLVRELDPDSTLHPVARNPDLLPRNLSDENSYLSVRLAKPAIETKGPPAPPRAPPAPAPPLPLEPTAEDCQFEVKKSTRFFEEEAGSDIKLYKTRSRCRGVLVMFSYVKFKADIEEFRQGVDNDCRRLKHLFSEFGFKVLTYRNLTKMETEETLRSLKSVLVGMESVFIVMSSHGHPREGTGDVDVRISDGSILSIYELVDHFNNKNFPSLRGIPKVFIFQVCRGPDTDFTTLGPGEARLDGSTWERASPPATPPAPARRPPSAYYLDSQRENRINSDILIAHSTLPGFVSRRDPRAGSWYIQALCDVFAARAHDCHVETLFTLVDEHLRTRHRIQTSSVDKWGFNKRLYLHPGLFED